MIHHHHALPSMYENHTIHPLHLTISYNMCLIHLNSFLHLHECKCIHVVHILQFFSLVYHRYHNLVSYVKKHFAFLYIPLFSYMYGGLIMVVQQLFHHQFVDLSIWILNVTSLAYSKCINHNLFTYDIHYPFFFFLRLKKKDFKSFDHKHVQKFRKIFMVWFLPFNVNHYN